MGVRPAIVTGVLRVYMQDQPLVAHVDVFVGQDLVNGPDAIDQTVCHEILHFVLRGKDQLIYCLIIKLLPFEGFGPQLEHVPFHFVFLGFRQICQSAFKTGLQLSV